MFSFQNVQFLLLKLLATPVTLGLGVARGSSMHTQDFRSACPRMHACKHAIIFVPWMTLFYRDCPNLLSYKLIVSFNRA